MDQTCTDMKNTSTATSFEEFRIANDPDGIMDPDFLATRWAQIQKKAIIKRFQACWNMDDIKKLLTELENE